MAKQFKRLSVSIVALIIAINSFARESKTITLTVNKNFELFYAMYISTNADSMLMANHYSGFPLVTKKNFNLKRNFYESFGKYKNSSPVTYYNQLASKGFVFGAPLNTLLHVDSNLNITDSCFFESPPFPQSSPEEVTKSLFMFINKLKEFSAISHFDEFYKENQPTYDKILKIQNDKVPLQKLVWSIEDFFGWGLKGYHVTLVPLMWPGGISLPYHKNCIDSLTEINICIGTKSVNSGIPYFGSDDEYKSVVVHEFVHPFIMRYCMEHKKQIDKYATLYQLDEDTYKINGCPDWFSAINEVLTRTVEIIINSEGDIQKANRAVEFQSKDLGFSLLPITYKAFNQHYSPVQKKQIDLDAVFSDMVCSFNEIESE